MEVLLVSCTFPDHEIAWEISRAAVGNGLAACATLTPEAKSIYRWKGQIETAQETTVTFKTTKDQFDALRKFVVKDHPVRSSRGDCLAGVGWLAGVPGVGGSEYAWKRIDAKRPENLASPTIGRAKNSARRRRGREPGAQQNA
jgi:periplasmic divalent cation tolerance protein